MTVLVTVLAITGALTWAVIILGIVGRLIFGPATRTVDQALADVAATDPTPANVVPLNDPRHNPLTCRECMGVDRGGVS